MLLLNGLSHRLAPGRRLVQGELIKHLAAGARAGGGESVQSRVSEFGTSGCAPDVASSVSLPPREVG